MLSGADSSDTLTAMSRHHADRVRGRIDPADSGRNMLNPRPGKVNGIGRDAVNVVPFNDRPGPSWLPDRAETMTHMKKWPAWTGAMDVNQPHARHRLLKHRPD